MKSLIRQTLSNQSCCISPEETVIAMYLNVKMVFSVQRMMLWLITNDKQYRGIW